MRSIDMDKKNRLEISSGLGRWSWLALLLWTLTMVVEQLGYYFGTPNVGQSVVERVLSEAVYDRGFFGLIHVLNGAAYVFLLFLFFDGLRAVQSWLRFVVALLGVVSIVATVVMVIPSGDSVYDAVREVSWWSGFRSTFLTNEEWLSRLFVFVIGVWLTCRWRGRMRWCGVSWWLCLILSGVCTGLAMRAMMSLPGHEAECVGVAWRVLSVLFVLLPMWFLCGAMTTDVSAVKVSGDDDVRI